MTPFQDRDTPGLPRKIRRALHFYRLTGYVGEVIRAAITYIDTLETTTLLCIYETDITCKCPVNGGSDHYVMTVRSSRMIVTSHIRGAVDRLTAEPTFQEDLAQKLAAELGATVELVGWHEGIRVTTTCGVGTA